MKRYQTLAALALTAGMLLTGPGATAAPEPTVREKSTAQQKARPPLVKPSMGVLKAIKCQPYGTNQWLFRYRFKVTGGKYESLGSGMNHTPDRFDNPIRVADGRAINVITSGTFSPWGGGDRGIPPNIVWPSFQHLVTRLDPASTVRATRLMYKEDNGTWNAPAECNGKWHKATPRV